MDRSLLVSELNALIVETRRKHPDIRQAAEAALSTLISLAETQEQTNKSGMQLVRNSWESQNLIISSATEKEQTLLTPILAGCKTRIPKVVAICLSALQRLISLRFVSGVSVPMLLQMLNAVVNQGVDIQLKIVQILLLLLTYCPGIHDEVLSEVLSQYFKLQDSRTSVVSSTASASLRQAIVMVFERTETKGYGDTSHPVTLPEGDRLLLSDNEWDAYCLFSDLCSETEASFNSTYQHFRKEPRSILKTHGVAPSFGLELIESILSGFADGFQSRPELVSLLRHTLCPLLSRLSAQRPAFPVMLRVIRVVFLLLRYFFVKIPSQAERFWDDLIHASCGESGAFVHSDDGNEKQVKNQMPQPIWWRCMMLEVIKALCRDAELLRLVWRTFDCSGKIPIYSNLISGLRQILSEKPAELGVNRDFQGVGLSFNSFGDKSQGYIGLGIGVVSSAANASVNTVSAMIGTDDNGRLDATCNAKVQCIEQHDKMEPNPVPNRYPYILALDVVFEVVNGLAAQRKSLSADHFAMPSEVSLETAQSTAKTSEKSMLEDAWPPLLACLANLIGTNLSAELFEKVLLAIKTIVIASDDARLSTCRDAFLTTLSRFAVPPAVLNALQSLPDAKTIPRNPSEANINAGPGLVRPDLSERNILCLDALLDIVQDRMATMDTAWYEVLSVFNAADFVLGKHAATRRIKPTSAVRSSRSMTQLSSSVVETDTESLHNVINHLLVSTANLTDNGFRGIVIALSTLGSDLLAIPRPSGTSARRDQQGASEGHHASIISRSSEHSFVLTMLDAVLTVNVDRMIQGRVDDVWDVIVEHILAVIQAVHIAPSVTTQATKLLDKILRLATLSIDTLPSDRQSNVQRRVLAALTSQVSARQDSAQTSTELEIRNMGLHTLLGILETSGHTIAAVWPTVFGILETVCNSADQSEVQSSQLSKTKANLIRTAFSSLNLACSDYLSTFSADTARLCIHALFTFSTQPYDLNIALSSIGLLWNVIDAIQSDLIVSDMQAQENLWLQSLNCLLRLTRGHCPELRTSAIQTMFRSLDTHGTRINASSWNSIMELILVPLVWGNTEKKPSTTSPLASPTQDQDSTIVSEDESRALALRSIASLLTTHREKLSGCATFPLFVEAVSAMNVHSFNTSGSRICSAALDLCRQLCSGCKEPDSAYCLLSQWKMIGHLHDRLGEMREPYLTQENLLDLVKFIHTLTTKIHLVAVDGEDIELALKTARLAVTYTHCSAYPLDVDEASPLQIAGLNLLRQNQIAETCSSDVILANFAEYITLAFIGGFDYTDTSIPSGRNSHKKRVTYVGLTKASMAAAVDFVLEQPTDKQILTCSGMESLIGALALPVKLRADCPPASKFGKAEALWKTASKSFVAIVTQVVSELELKAEEMDEKSHSALWEQILEVFRAVTMAEDSHLTGITIEEQIQEEKCDLMVITVLGSIWEKTIGYPKMSDRILEQLASILSSASSLYVPEEEFLGSNGEVKSVAGQMEAVCLPRSSVRYLCLDMMFAGADRNHADELKGRRLSTVVLPLLLARCKTALNNFLTEAPLRGNYPFPRIVEEELVYLLQKLSELQLWPRSFPVKSEKRAADDDADIKLPLIQQALQESTRAHLFYLYTSLLNLVAAPLPLPKVWFTPSDHSYDLKKGNSDRYNGAYEIDSRQLARNCLDAIGREIGL